MKNSLNLTGNDLKVTLGRLLSPMLETLAGKIEIAGAVQGVTITASPDDNDGLTIQSSDSDAQQVVEGVLHMEMRQ